MDPQPILRRDLYLWLVNVQPHPYPIETPRALLCLVYCAWRKQSCFHTILRIPAALLSSLAPCTLHPESFTVWRHLTHAYVHTAMHHFELQPHMRCIIRIPRFAPVAYQAQTRCAAARHVYLCTYALFAFKHLHLNPGRYAPLIAMHHPSQCTAERNAHPARPICSSAMYHTTMPHTPHSAATIASPIRQKFVIAMEKLMI